QLLQKNEEDERDEEKIEVVNLVYIFSFVWSIGGNIMESNRESFDEFVRDKFSTLVSMPGTGTVYNYYIDIEARAFKKWIDLIQPFQYDKKLPFHQVILL